MPTNILKSLQKTIKKFRKEKRKKGKVVRSMNPIYSSGSATKVKKLLLTRRQEAKQNIKLGIELKNSVEKFLMGEKKKERKSRKGLKSKARGRRSRSKSSRRSRRSRSKSSRRRRRSRSKSTRRSRSRRSSHSRRSRR